MKRHLLLLALPLLLVLPGCRTEQPVAPDTSISAFLPGSALPDDDRLWNIYSQGEHLSCQNGNVRLAKVVRPLFLEKFQTANDNWEAFENQDDNLSIDFGTQNGISGLVIKPAKEGPTAFALRSRPFPVVGGSSFFLAVSAAGTLNMRVSANKNRQYCSRVVWLDAKERVIDEFAFNVDTLTDAPMRTPHLGIVPPKATHAVLYLGADSPSFHASDYVVFTNVQFQGEGTDSRYWSNGKFVSRPFPITPSDGDSITWNATTPRETAVYFQISTAPDVLGAPGTWTPFAGPGNDPQRAFTTSGEPLPPIPEGHRWIRYLARLHGQGTKTPILHAVTIARAKDSTWVGPDLFPPSVRRSTPAIVENGKSIVAFEIKDETMVNWRTASVTCDGRDVTTHVRHVGAMLVYTPAAEMSAGLHTFKVTIQDESANQCEQEFAVLVGPILRRNLVSVQGDGMLQVDGRPFFPIVAYDVWQKPFNNTSFAKAFRDLRQAGFNTVQTYVTPNAPAMNDFMKAADATGMKALVSCGTGINSTDFRAILADVAQQRLHPAVLGWYLSELPSSGLPPKSLQYLHDAVHEIDPAHITFRANTTAHIPWETPDSFATDAILPWIFPITDRVNRVPEFITAMKNLRQPVEKGGSASRTIIPVLQVFSDAKHRFPDFNEVRAMAYLAVAYGANGLGFYTYSEDEKTRGMTSNPDIWRNVTKISSELGLLQHFLLQPSKPCSFRILDGPTLDLEGHPSLHCILKESGGRHFLLCVNSTRETVQASFQARETDQVLVHFENRNIPVKKDRFADTFRPLDVHVYELKLMY
ncbi:MAG: hypothetical protein IJJ26_06775 [Victivallales bacterium]|nr:hypothetical protein [Victivallales bacterium]